MFHKGATNAHTSEGKEINYEQSTSAQPDTDPTACSPTYSSFHTLDIFLQLRHSESQPCVWEEKILSTICKQLKYGVAKVTVQLINLIRFHMGLLQITILSFFLLHPLLLAMWYIMDGMEGEMAGCQAERERWLRGFIYSFISPITTWLGGAIVTQQSLSKHGGDILWKYGNIGIILFPCGLFWKMYLPRK